MMLTETFCGNVSCNKIIARNGVTAASDGSVYVTGRANDGTYYAFIAKYDANGNILWQRKLQQNNSIGNGVTAASDGSVYVTGNAIDGTNYAFIAKYDANGSILWQRKLQQNNSIGNGVTAASDGSVYVTGYANDGTNYAFIAKYDANGSILWQRRLQQNTSRGNGVTAASDGSVYVTGQANDGTSDYAFIAKLPPDGDCSGVLNSLLLLPGTAIESAGTATASTGAVIEGAGTATESVGTATESAGTLTTSYSVQEAVTSAGGLCITKSRSGTTGWRWVDTVKGATFSLESNSTAAQATEATGLVGFLPTGALFGADADYNTSGSNYVDYFIRKAPKILRYRHLHRGWRSRAANSWAWYCAGDDCGEADKRGWLLGGLSVLGTTKYLLLNTADFAPRAGSIWNSTEPDSQVFTVGGIDDVNGLGSQYVAYLFAHDDSEDGMIQCGSYVGNGTPRWLEVYRAWF